MSNLRSTGSWEGICEPSNVHHSMLLGSRNEGFVSELNCTQETLALSPVGLFFYQICFSSPDFQYIDSSTDTHLCYWVTVQSLGSWDSLMSHPTRTRAEFLSVCRVLWVWALAHMAAHLSCLIMRRSSCGKSVSVKSRGVHTAACTS